MSIENQSVARTMLDLGHIIHLSPESDPSCVGFAPSKRRRCQIHPKKSMTDTAVLLLELGSKQLRAGQSVDALLDSLAPCVLCTRFHQNQAQGIVAGWKNRIREFWSTQAAATSPRQSNDRPPSSQTETGISSTASASGRQDGGYHRVANSATISVPSAPSTALAERSNPLPSTSPMPPQGASEPTRDPATITTPRERVHRRPVEGDCGICMERMTRLNESAELGDNTSRIGGNEDQELVWCKSSCGNNFHRVCMGIWVAQSRQSGRQTPCPMCRVRWQE